MRYLQKLFTFSVTMLSLLFAIPIATQAQTQMSNVKHVFIILMENHNWTGDNSGASFGAPDIKGSALAPYINSLIPLRAHAEQYYNPPGNHPSLPNYLWLEAGTNFGILNDNLPTRKNGHRLNGQTTTAHLVTQLVSHVPAITWKAYAEPDFPNTDFTDCPLDFSEVDLNHGRVQFVVRQLHRPRQALFPSGDGSELRSDLHACAYHHWNSVLRTI